MDGGDSMLRRDAVTSPSMPYTYTYTEVLQVLGIAVIVLFNDN